MFYTCKNCNKIFFIRKNFKIHQQLLCSHINKNIPPKIVINKDTTNMVSKKESPNRGNENTKNRIILFEENNFDGRKQKNVAEINRAQKIEPILKKNENKTEFDGEKQNNIVEINRAQKIDPILKKNASPSLGKNKTEFDGGKNKNVNFGDNNMMEINRAPEQTSKKNVDSLLKEIDKLKNEKIKLTKELCKSNINNIYPNNKNEITIQDFYIFNNKKMSIINIKNCLLFDYQDAADILHIKNTNLLLKNNIQNEDKYILGELLKENKIDPAYNMDVNRIYINEYGLYYLIYRSKNKNIYTIKNILVNKIIPEFKNANLFSEQSSDISSGSFYDDNMITPYKDKNVLYLGITDEFIDISDAKSEANVFYRRNENKDEESDNIKETETIKRLYKLGISRRIIMRDFDEHKKIFKKFRLIYIIECDNKEIVEGLFKEELRAKNLLKTLMINNKKYVEMFITTEKYSIKYIVNILNALVRDNPLKSIEIRDRMIEKLKSNNDIKKMEEKTKQMELEYKILELKKKLDNHNIKI